MVRPLAGETVRAAQMAGRFYPDAPGDCRRYAEQYIHLGRRVVPAGRWLGGVVPHASWQASGAVAGETIAALGLGSSPEVVVVFGAVHTAYDGPAAADTYAAWEVPGGRIDVVARVRQAVCRSGPVVCDDTAHEGEHAIEVELPLIQRAWAGAEVLAIEVPSDDRAVAVGEWVAEAVDRQALHAVFLASSDFTHYGPSYGLDPVGGGPAGIEWAMDNDRRILDIILEGRAEDVVPEAEAHRNACGSGAIAAMIAACRVTGHCDAKLIQHTCSARTLADRESRNSVGYCSLVIGQCE